MNKLTKCFKDVIVSAPGYVLLNALVLILAAVAQVGISFFLGILVQAVSGETDSSRLFAQAIVGFAVCICIGGNTSNVNELLSTLFTKKSKKYIYNNFIQDILSEKQDSFEGHEFFDELMFAENNIESTTNVCIKFFNKLFGSVFTIVIGCCAIAYVDRVILGLVLVQALLLTVINKYIVRNRMQINRKYIEEERKADYFKKILTSKKECREVFGYGIQDFFLAQWERAFLRFAKAKSTFQMKVQLLMFIQAFLRQACIVLLTIYYLQLIRNQQITMEQFVFVNGSMWILVNHINRLVMILTYEMKEDIEKTEKYYEFTGQLKGEDNREASRQKEVKDFHKIELKNLSYRYPGQVKDAVHGINLEIPKGQIISILGHNGSGKSTLSKILCGCLENYEGRMSVDGISVAKLDKDSFSALWGIGFQEFTRFSFSILENIQIGFIEKGRDEAVLAAGKAGLQEIIDKMPLKENTILGKEYDENGQELSGGEWQRIILARAYMGEHSVIILDEPTAAVDPLEEYRLLENIREQIGGSTVILISHRIGFAKLADRILVMKEGKIVEDGTHESLTVMQGEYYRMFCAQKKLYDRGDI